MNTLDLILLKCGDELINKYREKLALYNVNSSGLLGNTLTCFVNVEDGVYELNLQLQEYWKYIEEGREPGTFPNIDAIKNWIKIKPVIPNIYNGKLPTLNQLTYLIGRKIEREGIEGKHILKESINENEVIGNLNEQLSDLITKDVELIFKDF